jgi:hypothetical protein
VDPCPKGICGPYKQCLTKKSYFYPHGGLTCLGCPAFANAPASPRGDPRQLTLATFVRYHPVSCRVVCARPEKNARQNRLSLPQRAAKSVPAVPSLWPVNRLCHRCSSKVAKRNVRPGWSVAILAVGFALHPRVPVSNSPVSTIMMMWANSVAAPLAPWARSVAIPVVASAHHPVVCAPSKSVSVRPTS